MTSHAVLEMGRRGRPRAKSLAVGTSVPLVIPNVSDSQRDVADCQSSSTRMPVREVESVGDARMVRQFNIKWKDSPDWTWVNEEDFLKFINNMAAVVAVQTTQTTELKKPVAGGSSSGSTKEPEPCTSVDTAAEKSEERSSTVNTGLSIIKCGSKRPQNAPDDDELSTSSEFTELPQRKKVNKAALRIKKQASVESEYVPDAERKKKKRKIDSSTRKTDPLEKRCDSSSPEINGNGPSPIAPVDHADLSSQPLIVSEVEKNALNEGTVPYISTTNTIPSGSGNVLNMSDGMKIPKKLVFTGHDRSKVSLNKKGVSSFSTSLTSSANSGHGSSKQLGVGFTSGKSLSKKISQKKDVSISSLKGRVPSSHGKGTLTLTTTSECSSLTKQGDTTDVSKGISSSHSSYGTPQLSSTGLDSITDGSTGSKEWKAGSSSSNQEVSSAAHLMNKKTKKRTEPSKSSVASLVKQHWKSMQRATKSHTLSPPPRDKVIKEQYEVERVIGALRLRKADYFLVHWKGYPDSENSWEIRSSMRFAKDTIDTFQFEFGKLTREKTSLFSPEGEAWDAAHPHLRP